MSLILIGSQTSIGVVYGTKEILSSLEFSSSFPIEIHIANHDENHTENIPNDLGSIQKGPQFSFSSPTIPIN